LDVYYSGAGLIPYRIIEGGIALFIRLTPKGGRDGFDSIEADSDGKVWLKARVRSVPEDGKANAALEVLLAKSFGVSKSAVSVTSGHTARNKQVEIKGDSTALVAVLRDLVPPPK
jgi:uncharacterized protein YggU (UPF0235/DUF167 family)